MFVAVSASVKHIPAHFASPSIFSYVLHFNTHTSILFSMPEKRFLMTHFWACTPTYFFRQFWPTILGAADDTSEPPRERRQMTARLQTTKEAVTDDNPFKCNYYIFFVTHVAYSDQMQTVRKGRAGRLADVPNGLLQSSLFQLYANGVFSCQLTRRPLTLLLLPQTVPLPSPGFTPFPSPAAPVTAQIYLSSVSSFKLSFSPYYWYRGYSAFT